MKSNLSDSNQNLLIWEFSPEVVTKRNFNLFLEQWAADKMPRGEALQVLMNRFAFRFPGFPEGEFRICVEPQVRRFCKDFFEAWPYWFYFCNLASRDLFVVTLCCLSNLEIAERRSKKRWDLRFSGQELDWLLQRGKAACDCICMFAGLSEAQKTGRMVQVLDYLQHYLSHPECP